MAEGESINAKRDRLVIAASSLGTVFEWYDFFVYGTLAATIGKLFFPAGNDGAAFLKALAVFGVGFGMRPVGAFIFGILGDRLGRKYTFLVTITLMGIATAGIGFLPGYAAIGIAAPILLVTLRALQGLALGGEYGGAAIYVAEHAPRDKRGLYTGFIQGSVVGGFILSLVVVLTTNALVGKESDWAWRIPFIFSLVLLGFSLWMRAKLDESPVFKAMKEAGETARNPLRESFNSWAKTKLILAAMIGIAAGLTVIWYTAQFQALYFMQNALHIDDTVAQLVVGVGALASLFWFVFFGWLSDRVGRKKPMIVGYVLTLFLMFPLFHAMADAANPALSEAMAKNPVVVMGNDCSFNPFAQSGQTTPCGKVLDKLSKLGVAYEKQPYPETPGAGTIMPDMIKVKVGGAEVDMAKADGLESALKVAGYNLGKVSPPTNKLFVLILCIIAIGGLSGLTYGPVASYMVELFPARVRYTSMSIPYHIGTGYFGGFLPFISQYMVATSGNPFQGLWYTLGVVAVALVTMLLFLPETSGKELD